MNKKHVALAVLGLVGLAVVLAFCGRKRQSRPEIEPAATMLVEPSPVVPSTLTVTALPSPTPKAAPSPKAIPAVKVTTPKAMAQPTPPKIEVHEELIPANIEIVRVYYAQPITAPNTTVEFDINGSGFTKEFETMIKADSGDPLVEIKGLNLVTPNQIHGTLVMKAEAKTGLIFPRVLIQGKVVFVAPEPIGVVRPGEVLTLFFTEMGENGRSGRFRMFTNLTPIMFSSLSIVASTPSIQIADLQPALPYVVDGGIQVGYTPGGSYDVTVKLGDKPIWSRPGLIRVVVPNVGESGLVQTIRAADGYHRPGDTALFTLLGSGFQPIDSERLSVSIEGLAVKRSSFSFLSPGRMELRIDIPVNAQEKIYPMSIKQKDNVILSMERVFQVVPKNWVRDLILNPHLQPGATAALHLSGRELSEDFVRNLKCTVDSKDLEVGSFVWMDPEEAIAKVTAKTGLPPGDYLLKLSSSEKPIFAQFGNVVTVSKP